MAESEFRKIQLEQRKLDRRLDEIAKKRAKEFEEERKLSYCTHIPSEVRKMLSKRSRSYLDEEDLKRKYLRIKRR